jgi:hypothetical protein
MTRRDAVLLTAACGLGLAGCSDPPKPKAPEKPPEALSGRTAFFRMYGPARVWSPDIQVLRVSSIRVADVKDEPGKTGAWEAVFVSPSKRKSKTFTYSAVEAGGNLHKGFFSGLDDDWSGPSGQVMPFVVAALKVDSDEALATALKEKKVAAYAAKNPDKPKFYLLQYTKQFPDLTWRIVWGESVSSSDFSAFVDATTGQFLDIGR